MSESYIILKDIWGDTHDVFNVSNHIPKDKATTIIVVPFLELTKLQTQLKEANEVIYSIIDCGDNFYKNLHNDEILLDKKAREYLKKYGVENER